MSDPANRDGLAVQHTQWVYLKLRSVPANRDVMTKLPPEKVYTSPNPPVQPPSAPALGSAVTSVPIVLDSWGNPIIFVPRAGLSGVRKLPTENNGVVTYGQTNLTIKSPDGRPFFASAGEDGDFSKGDDNVYSFEQ